MFKYRTERFIYHNDGVLLCQWLPNWSNKSFGSNGGVIEKKVKNSENQENIAVPGIRITPSVLEALHISTSISEIVYYNRASMDQCHISMCHRAVPWTSNVTYKCAMGLRTLTLSHPYDGSTVIRNLSHSRPYDGSTVMQKVFF